MGERSVGWADLALVAFFVGFTIACWGVAHLAVGDASAVDVWLAVIGGAMFLGSGLSWIPLAKRDLARDATRSHARAAAYEYETLGVGSPLETGHVWHMHAIRIVAPAVFWLIFAVILRSGPLAWQGWAWCALAVLLSYVAWTSGYAVATSVSDDGVEIKAIAGRRTLRFSDVDRWWLGPPQGGMPVTLILVTGSVVLGPRVMIPLFDPRLLDFVVQRLGKPYGHT